MAAAIEPERADHQVLALVRRKPPDEQDRGRPGGRARARGREPFALEEDRDHAPVGRARVAQFGGGELRHATRPPGTARQLGELLRGPPPTPPPRRLRTPTRTGP